MVKHSNPGLFIAFEGLDGAGSSAQVALLAKALEEQGNLAVVLSTDFKTLKVTGNDIVRSTEETEKVLELYTQEKGVSIFALECQAKDMPSQYGFISCLILYPDGSKENRRLYRECNCEGKATVPFLFGWDNRREGKSLSN